MRYFLILWLLSALEAEGAIKYIDNVYLKEYEYIIPIPHSQSDGEKDVSVVFRNSKVHTLSEKLVKYFSSDQRITVSGCQLEKIDNFLDLLTKITNLNLSSNQISQLQANQFKWAPRLSVLDLSHNCINELSKSAFGGLYKLLKLDLSENQLKTLIERVFADLKNLKQLNLDGNSLTALQSSYFFGLGQLTTLKLQRNSLARIENSTFQSADRLTTIIMSENQISAVDTQAFYKLNELKNLCLNRNQLTSFGAIVLPQDIENLSLDSNFLKAVNFDAYLYLTHLSLNGNKEIHWRPTLFENLTELTQLCVSDTNMDGSLISDGLLQRLKNLEVLDVSKNPLEFLDMSSVPSMKNLTHLNLKECKLNNIQNFETIDEKFPKLEKLTIINNSLTCEFMHQLTSTLKPDLVIVKDDMCATRDVVNNYTQLLPSATAEKGTTITTENTTPTKNYPAAETSTTKNIYKVNSDPIPSTVASSDDDDHDFAILRGFIWWPICAMIVISVCIIFGAMVCFYRKTRGTYILERNTETQSQILIKFMNSNIEEMI